MSILIVYSSVGGNTKLVVQKVAELLEKEDFKVELRRVELVDPKEINSYELTILASPTYNQGTLEDKFKPFIKKFTKMDFSGHKFAVIGLGDNKYYPEYLTEAAGLLENAVHQTEGELVTPALRIGVSPLKVLEKLVPRWVNKLTQSLPQKSP